MAEKVLTTVRAFEGGPALFQVTFKRTSKKGSSLKPIVICEVCVTTIDPQSGTRTTVCQPIPCPKGGDKITVPKDTPIWV